MWYTKIFYIWYKFSYYETFKIHRKVTKRKIIHYNFFRENLQENLYEILTIL